MASVKKVTFSRNFQQNSAYVSLDINCLCSASEEAQECTVVFNWARCDVQKAWSPLRMEIGVPGGE